jgi:hypothetical protein
LPARAVAAAESAAVFSPPDTTNINYAVSVPASTSSSGSGPIFIQLSAPTSYQWFAFGSGTQMAGATIFVVYTNGQGNVTVSPRAGVGEVMPRFDATLNEKVTLLAGSGVSNGFMVANIRYDADASTITPASTSAPFIASWKTGSQLATTNQQQVISQHDDHSQFKLDLSKARLASDANPFVAAAASQGNSAASPTDAVVTVPQQSPAVDGVVGGTNVGVVAEGDKVDKYNAPHGVIMAIAVVIIFPLGAIVMRLFGLFWLHVGLQLLSLVLIIVGFALGVEAAKVTGYVSSPPSCVSANRTALRRTRLGPHRLWHRPLHPVHAAAFHRPGTPSRLQALRRSLRHQPRACLVRPSDNGRRDCQRRPGPQSGRPLKG